MFFYHLYVWISILKGSINQYKIFGPLIGGGFIFVSGVCLGNSMKRYNRKKLLKRILKIGFGALAISLGSYFVFKDCYVKFGILHFFSISPILLYPFKKKRKYLPILSLLLFVLWLYIREVYIPYFGILLGAKSQVCSMDYYPILPWISLYYLSFYLSDDIFNFLQKVDREIKPLYPIEILGRYSLLFYIFHFPIVFFLGTLLV